MKKIIYGFAMMALSFLYTSCDALDLAPEDFYGSGNFWKKEAEVKAFLIGMQSQLRSNYDMFYYLGEMRGGTQRTGSSSIGTSLNYDQIRLNQIDADNPGTSNFHGLYASSILQVNHYIDQVGKADFLTNDQKNAYLAPAHGLRALYYFMLYRTFGGVPLITEPKILSIKPAAESFYDKRATPQETMDFIKNEILKSEELYGGAAITNTYDKSSWSKAATLTLKAEIYMWAAKVSITGFSATGTADLQIAKSALDQLIGKFELQGEFKDIFSPTNKKNKEIILAIHFADGEATNAAGRFFYQDNLFINQKFGRDGKKITTDTLNLKGRGGVFRDEYSQAFWESFDPQDTRRDATFMEYYADADKKGFGCIMKKYIGSINANNNRVFDSDIVVYRYADVLLMRAEVANGLKEACADYVNQIRRRAYGANYAAHEFKEGSFADNELAILHERDKEFVAEGKRWFDVIRLQDAAQKPLVFSAAASYPATTPILSSSEPHKLLWPININTLTLNPELEQTPGYVKSE